MEIVKVDSKEYDVAENKALEIQGLFNPMLKTMVGLEAKYNELVKLPINEETCKKAKALRLEFRDTRTGTAKIHKQLKAESLAVGKLLDGWKNAQKSASDGMEEKLSDIEKHFENVEIERIKELQKSRELELEQYEVATIPQNLGAMQEDVWSNFLTGSRVNFEDKKKADEQEAARLEQVRIAAEEQAEIDRLEEIEKEKARKEMEAENEKLKLEAKEKEDARQKEIAIEAAKAKKKIDKAKAEAAKEKAKSEKLKAELKLNEQRAKLREKEQAEAQRKAAAAPDKEKLLAFGDLVVSLELPELTTKHGVLVVNNVKDLLKKVNDYIVKQSENF